MTREERHIAVLNRMLESMDVYDSIQPTTERKKAIKAAIQALSQEPISLNDINNALGASFRNGVRSAKVEQEPCDDAISRDAVLNTEYQVKIINDIEYVMLSEVQMKIRKMPSVTQKSGEWINDECGNVICSECKRFRRDCRFGHTNYCNHCGARMYKP